MKEPMNHADFIALRAGQWLHSMQYSHSSDRCAQYWGRWIAVTCAIEALANLNLAFETDVRESEDAK